MQAYRVIGIGFHVGPGALMLLGAVQAAERAHRVEPVGKPGKDFVLVQARHVQHFKRGELIGLNEMPKGLAHLVEPVSKSGKRGDPDALLVKAAADHRAQAEEAELQRQIAAEEAAKKQAADDAAAADAAQVIEWSQEYANNEAIRAKYPTADEYVAARRAEGKAAA